MIPLESVDVIPMDRIRQAFLAAAHPGLFGSVRLEVFLTQEAVEQLDIVAHEEFTQTGTVAAQQPVANQERRLAVDKMVRSIEQRARRRIRLVMITGHFGDGRLLKFNMEFDR